MTKAVRDLPVSCLRPATFWEGGPVRYLAMSYSLWTRHIFYDLIGRKPKKPRRK